MTMFHVKVIGDSVVKKVNVLNIFCGEIHVFRSNFRKERVGIMTLNHFSKLRNRSKKIKVGICKIMINDVESG